MGHYAGQLANSIQLKEYSISGGNESASHRAWAVNANWNPNYGYWNVNVNSVANLNEWNAGNQVLSKFFSFKNPAYWVFVCLCQPPSILPTSFRGSDRAMYFLLSSSPISQTICSMNFRISKVSEACVRRYNFCSRFLKLAERSCLIVSRNRLSMSNPIVYLCDLSNLMKYPCHNL